MDDDEFRDYDIIENDKPTFIGGKGLHRIFWNFRRKVSIESIGTDDDVRLIGDGNLGDIRVIPVNSPDLLKGFLPCKDLCALNEDGLGLWGLED